MKAGYSIARQKSGVLRIAAGSFLCAAALVIWQAAASIHALERADSAGAVLRQIEAVQRSLLWVRAEHRSAILSGDEKSLALYRDADRQLQSNLDQLSRVTLSDPARQRAIADLQGHVDSARARRERALTLRAANIEAATSALMSDDAAQARAVSTSAFDALARSAQTELTARAASERQALLLLFASIMGLLFAAAALVAFAINSIRRHGEEIEASEARYRALSDDCPDGILVVIEGRVVYANSAALELWSARTDHAVVGRQLSELVHPDDRDTLAARIQSVLAHGIATSPRVFRLLRSDGTTYEIEARKTLVEYGGKPAVQVMARDVTARRASELALALSEQRFRAVLDAMVEGVVLQDADGTIKLCNRAAERILGLSTDQLHGRTPAEPLWLALDESGSPLPGDRHYAMLALRTGQPTTGDMSVQRPDGTRASLRVSAIPLFRPGAERPYAVTTTFADITAERAATQRLQESMAQYRLLAEHSGDMVSRRTLDHRFDYVSPSHTAVLGWSQAELLSIRPLDLIHPDDLPHVISGTIASIARGESSKPTPLRVRHKSGHYVWVEGLSTPIKDAGGNVIAYTVCARDITARHLLEQQLRQAQKLEAMGHMAGAIAHDFNNILTVIRSATELLRTTPEPTQSPALTEYFAELGTAVDRAARLTASLLSVGHGQHSVPRLLSAATLLRESHELLQRLVPDRCTLKLQLTGEQGQIWADKSELLQILANLVMNAADSMPDGGSIVIECGMEQLVEPWTHRFGSLPPGSYVTISVSDGGVGIQPAALEHIFEPFFTTKPQAEGAGLGLATVWGIVQQAQGSITLDSVKDRGSRFTIYWPHHQTPAHASSIPRSAVHADSRAAALRSGGTSPAQTVLVVDDEAAVLRLTTRLLERAGYRVLAAPSGAEALKLLKERRRAVQLVVSDVRMPEMGGVELVSQLLAAGIDLPVLFMSGQLDAPLPTNWPRTMPRRFLAKPFTLEQFLPAIEQLLRDTGFEQARTSN